VSEGAVEKARALARAEGHTHIHYRVADINKASLEENAYDVVFGISSIHHIVELESLYAKVYRALKPGGYFYMDEFVGPSQYQWSNAQLEAVNAILKQIPERLRVRRSDGKLIRNSVVRPTIDQMNAVDPSEAIRSSEIIPLLSGHFPGFILRGYGGNILHLLLEDIAGNFVESDAEAMEWMERIFAYEDDWIAREGVGDNFAVIVARKPLK
jgi:SAM-dependent methyltransferase